MNAFVDKVGVVLVMAQADIPGQGIQPQAPPGLAGKMNTFLSWVQYFGIFFAVVGVIVAGIGLVLSRREGSSEGSNGEFLADWVGDGGD